MWLRLWCLGCKHWANQGIGRVLLGPGLGLVMVRLCVTSHGFLSEGLFRDEIVSYFFDVD